MTGDVLFSKLDPSAEEFTCVDKQEDGTSELDGVEHRKEVCDTDFGKSVVFLHGRP